MVLDVRSCHFADGGFLGVTARLGDLTVRRSCSCRGPTAWRGSWAVKAGPGAGGSRAGAAAEVLTGEADGDRALADRRGYSFDRVAAHVAGREHARQAGFEQVGIAAQLFPGGRVAGLPAEVRAGDDEAVAVQLDRFSQPLRVRLGADQDEQGRGGKYLPGRRGE